MHVITIVEQVVRLASESPLGAGTKMSVSLGVAVGVHCGSGELGCPVIHSTHLGDINGYCLLSTSHVPGPALSTLHV